MLIKKKSRNLLKKKKKTPITVAKMIKLKPREVVPNKVLKMGFGLPLVLL